MAAKGATSILVTGAEGALGQAVVSRLLEDPAVRVAGLYFNAPASGPVESGRFKWVQADLGKSAKVKEAVTRARAALGGRIDGLIHCAGGFRWAKLEDTRDEDIDFLIDANFKSSVLLLRELLPEMKQQGFGRVVLTSARSTMAPNAGVSVYAGTKAAINALVSSVADEVRAFDINVNAVLPTMIDTAANRKSMPDADFSTWVSTGELAEIMFGLTQAWGRPMHGALIPVSGRL